MSYIIKYFYGFNFIFLTKGKKVKKKVFIFTSIIILGCMPSIKEVKKANTITSDYNKYQLIGPKKRVYVADFTNKSRYGQNRISSSISEILTTELSKTNLFIMVEREKIDLLLSEQMLSESGVIDERSAVKVRNLLGANAIITGSITQFGMRTETNDKIVYTTKRQIATCTVDIRIIDVITGRIFWAGAGEGEALRKHENYLGTGTAGSYDETLEGDAFRAAIIQLMDNLVSEINQMPWSCNVVKIGNDDVIYINAGYKSNLKNNVKLSIYNLGETIFDNTTGLELGRVETYVATAKVISQFGEDGSVVKIIEGSVPEEGA